MVQQKFRIFCIFMMLIAVTRSGLVARRDAPQEGDEDFDKDAENFNEGRGLDTETGDEAEDDRTGENPESPFTEPDDGNDENDVDSRGPFDDKDDLDESVDDRNDPEVPDPEEDVDESVGDRNDPEVPVTEEDVDESGGDGGLVPGMENVGLGPFGGGGSLFDIPLFSFPKVRQYFHELEKALAHVFRQTLEEARLLNGTYANTTEEEVEINGKKFIVQKSIIKGGDNHSSIYVETLSSKSKEDEQQETNGMEIRNETKKEV